MIQIYKDINSDFEVNGEVVLKPTICKLKIEINGVCEIEGEHSFDEEGRWKYIKAGSIIACPTPYSEKQLFRIYHAPPSIEGIKIYARHIFFDLDDDTMIDVRPTNCSCKEALDKILYGTRFKGHSNINIINTSNYIRKTRVEAICSDDDNSIAKRYKGERLYDNFDVYINETIGGDYGVRAEFGYNLKQIEGGPNYDGMITSIIPVGFDAIMLDGDSPWVDSPIIDKYDHIIRRTVDMEDIKVKESEEDEEGYSTIEEARIAMIERCNKLFDSGIDKPIINYSVEMEDLSSTTEYKKYEELEKVSIGDTVTCRHKGLDLDLKARCISMEWDCISKKPITIELGDVIENFFNKQSDIQNRVDNILNSNGSVKGDEIQGFINATKASIKAQKDVAQLLDVRAIECEDLDPDSPNFGSWIGGTKGVMVSDTRTSDGRDWDYTSALTAKGLVANLLYGKVLAGGGVYFDLETGEIHFNKGLIQGSNSSWNLDTGVIQSKMPDGSKIVISPADGFYRQVGESKNQYYNLNWYTNKWLRAGEKNVKINLPSEFADKRWKAVTTITGTWLNAETGKFYCITRNDISVMWEHDNNLLSVDNNCLGMEITTKEIVGMDCSIDILIVA